MMYHAVPNRVERGLRWDLSTAHVWASSYWFRHLPLHRDIHILIQQSPFNAKLKNRFFCSKYWVLPEYHSNIVRHKISWTGYWRDFLRNRYYLWPLSHLLLAKIFVWNISNFLQNVLKKQVLEDCFPYGSMLKSQNHGINVGHDSIQNKG